MAQEALIDLGPRDGFVSADERGERVPCLDWFTQSLKQTAEIIEKDRQGIDSTRLGGSLARPLGMSFSLV
jgi:hypothetical protein